MRRTGVIEVFYALLALLGSVVSLRLVFIVTAYAWTKQSNGTGNALVVQVVGPVLIATGTAYAVVAFLYIIPSLRAKLRFWFSVLSVVGLSLPLCLRFGMPLLLGEGSSFDSMNIQALNSASGLAGICIMISGVGTVSTRVMRATFVRKQRPSSAGERDAR
jgi:hypothetical protein